MDVMTMSEVGDFRGMKIAKHIPIVPARAAPRLCPLTSTVADCDNTDGVSNVPRTIASFAITTYILGRNSLPHRFENLIRGQLESLPKT